VQRIDADLLVPGRGEPVHGGTVVLEDSRITYAGAAADAPETPDADTHSVPVVMPGMWDCHGHFFGVTVPDIAQLMTTSPVLAGARIPADAAAALDAGFTSVREPGGLGLHLAKAIEEGTVRGPHVHAAGSVVSTTGGHGDIHAYPIEWVHELARRYGGVVHADGVPECLRAVRSQLRLGAKFIKFCASGGVMSEIDHPTHQQFSLEEMCAIVEEAGRAERVVAAHCHGKPGIMAALQAGVRTIEHGTYLDEEAADAMVETGAILVATRFVVEPIREAGRSMGVPEYAQRKLDGLADQHADAVALAHEKGVPIAVGTDIFTSGPHAMLRWGDNARELELLVKLGLTPLEAIEAATARGPVTLGPQGPRSGVLAEGTTPTSSPSPPTRLTTSASSPRRRTSPMSGRRVTS
jgi:imidazolonepropionase-like amidohydrolase